MTSEIGIIDYGMGNIKSLSNALKVLGFDCRICSDPAGIADLSHLIVPGVGAYKLAADNLSNRGFVQPLRNHSISGRPLLGICLGMQLLSTTGTEPVLCNGLDLIPGEVVHLPDSLEYPCPHVGWNSLNFEWEHPVFSNLKKSVDYYFVHSFQFIPNSKEDILAHTEYGMPFCSIVARNNIVGVQFHPEKSQEQGLRLLENFVSWDGQC